MPSEDGAAARRELHAASMDRVFRYIDARLGEDLDLGELASVAAYSKYHFSRVFRAAAGGMVVRDFSPGDCAVGAFRCAPGGFQAAWDWMYGTRLPACGRRPADVPPFERCGPGAFDPATGLTAVEICVPLERP